MHCSWWNVRVHTGVRMGVWACGHVGASAPVWWAAVEGERHSGGGNRERMQFVWETDGVVKLRYLVVAPDGLVCCIKLLHTAHHSRPVHTGQLCRAAMNPMHDNNTIGWKYLAVRNQIQ